jgi:hypothetical protein
VYIHLVRDCQRALAPCAGGVDKGPKTIVKEINWLKLPGRRAAACIHQSSGSAFASVDTDERLQVDLDDLAVVRSFKTKSEPDCCFALDGTRAAGAR